MTSCDTLTAHYQFSHWTTPGGIAVAEENEETLGVPMLPDAEDDSRYLSKVVLTGRGAGVEFWLRRSDASVSVWADANRLVPLMTQGTADEAPVVMDTGGQATVWVEYEGSAPSGSATLQLLAAPVQAEEPEGATLVAAMATADDEVRLTIADLVETVRIKESHKLVVGFSGHTQGMDPDEIAEGIADPLDERGEWMVERETGAFKIARKLMEDYPVLIVPEDPGGEAAGEAVNCGQGVQGDETHPGGALEDVVQAFLHHGAEKLAMYGYSHGGGSVYWMSRFLEDLITPNDERETNGDDDYYEHRADFAAKFNQNSLVWTGYIDAVELPIVAGDLGGANWGAETRPPRLTPLHFSRIQGHPDDTTPEIHGALMDPEVVEIQGVPIQLTRLNITIDEDDVDYAVNNPTQRGADTTEDSEWPGRRTHLNNPPENKGIAEDPKVQEQLIASLNSAMTA